MYRSFQLKYDGVIVFVCERDDHLGTGGTRRADW